MSIGSIVKGTPPVTQALVIIYFISLITQTTTIGGKGEQATAALFGILFNLIPFGIVGLVLSYNLEKTFINTLNYIIYVLVLLLVPLVVVIILPSPTVSTTASSTPGYTPGTTASGSNAPVLLSLSLLGYPYYLLIVCAVVGLLIRLKQVIPQHSLKLLKGFISIRVKFLAFVVLIYETIWSIFIYSSVVPIALILTEILIIFVYLHSFSNSSSNSFINSSCLVKTSVEEFTLISLFPSTLHPLLLVLINPLYNLFTKLKLYPPSSSNSISNSSSVSSGTNSNSNGSAGTNTNNDPSSTTLFDLTSVFTHHHQQEMSDSDYSSTAATTTDQVKEAERRRALALKALENRLQYLSTSSNSKPVPSNTTSPSATANNSTPTTATAIATAGSNKNMV